MYDAHLFRTQHQSTGSKFFCGNSHCKVAFKPLQYWNLKRRDIPWTAGWSTCCCLLDLLEGRWRVGLRADRACSIGCMWEGFALGSWALAALCRIFNFGTSAVCWGRDFSSKGFPAPAQDQNIWIGLSKTSLLYVEVALKVYITHCCLSFETKSGHSDFPANCSTQINVYSQDSWNSKQNYDSEDKEVGWVQECKHM